MEIKSQWVTDSHIGPKTIKPLEENTGQMELNIDIGSYCFGYDAKTQARKTANWDCIQV